MTASDRDERTEDPAVTWRRRYRRLLVIAGLVSVGVVVLVAWPSLVPFFVGVVVAYLLLPAVNFVEGKCCPKRWRGKKLTRPLSILVVYIVALALLAGMISTFVPLVSEQATAMRERAPEYYEGAQQIFFQVFDFYQRVVPQDWQDRIQQSLQQALERIDETAQAAVSRLFGIVTETIGVILGLVVVPFWMFYLLNDSARLGRQFFTTVPPRYRSDVYNILKIVDGILSGYVRGQLVLALVIAVLSTVGLLFLDVDLALLLGTVAGICEVIPYVGPIIGAVPAVIVALTQSSITALWVVVLFVGIQQVENLFLSPRITGGSVRLSPALVMLVLVVGSGLAGMWGLLLAVPVTAVFRDVFRYLYMRLSDREIPSDEAYARVRGGAAVRGSSVDLD